MSRTQAREYRKRAREGLRYEDGQGLGLGQKLLRVAAHDVRGAPGVLEIPEHDGKHPHGEPQRHEGRPGVAPGPAAEQKGEGDRPGVREGYGLLPEGGSEQEADAGVAQARGAAREVFVEHAREQGEGHAAQSQHVHVLAHAVEGEGGEELGAQGEVEPGDERRSPARDAAGEGHAGRDEHEVQEQAREDHEPGEVAASRDEGEERGQVALERALVVRALREDRRGTRPLEEVEGDEGPEGPVLVDPSPGMDERREAVGHG